MSPVDLSRLIVRKRYSLPIGSSDLKTAITKALTTDDPGILGESGWILTDEHENCLVFQRSLSCFFLRYEKKATANNAAKLLKKFTGDPNSYFEVLGKMRSGFPFELSVYLIKANSSSCVADVTSKPFLYPQIVQLNKEASDVDIQDSYFTSEEFMKRIFEGGLSGTIISEEKPTIQKAVTELLINDAHLRQITEKINKMLDEATGEVLITGWIGTFLIDKFTELKKKGIRISVVTGNTKDIRQDAMRNEKEKAMVELVSLLGKSNISSRADLHGRMVVVDNKTLIGSMDMDSYSLTGARFEFAVYTEEPAIVRTLRNYFNSIFSAMDKKGEQKKQET